jgi:hypothetical protein
MEDELSYESQFYLASRNGEKNIVVQEFIQQFIAEKNARKKLYSVE